MDGFLDRFRPMTPEQKDRIWQEIVERCQLVADCWIYPVTNSAGYGIKKVGGKIVTTSRFTLAYHSRESLSIKMDACHHLECPYRACCNPRHLFWGTHQKNAEMREEEKRERRKMEIMLPPVSLGHLTHEEWGVDTSLQPEMDPSVVAAYA